MKNPRYIHILAVCLMVFTLACPLTTASAASNEEEKVYPLPRVYIEDADIRYVAEYTGVTIRMEDEYGRTVLEDGEAEWRTHGHTTASKPKRPYKIKLSSSQSLFGMDKTRRYVLLANLFDKSLLRNRLALELGQALDIPYTSDSCFVDVYLNGRYRGNYLMVEAVRVGSGQVNIHPAANEFLLEVVMGKRKSEGVTVKTPVEKIILEVSGVDSLESEQETFLTEFFEKAENALVSGQREEIEAYFDIESFVRTYLLNEFSKNPDTGFASSRFYIKQGKLYAGPPWDFDLAFGEDLNPTSDKLHWQNFNCPAQTHGWYATSLWWHRLVGFDWFQQRFGELYREMQPTLVNLYADNELGMNRLDALSAAMEESISENFKIWPITNMYSRLERMPASNYPLNVEYLRGWLQARNQWILAQLNDTGDFIVLRD